MGTKRLQQPAFLERGADMITSLILTAAVGAILGLRFKVFVLAPAMLIVGGYAIIAGMLAGHDTRFVLLSVAGTLALLQIGYTAGCLILSALFMGAAPKVHAALLNPNR